MVNTSILDAGTGWLRVDSVYLRSLYPVERNPGTSCRGNCVARKKYKMAEKSANRNKYADRFKLPCFLPILQHFFKLRSLKTFSVNKLLGHFYIELSDESLLNDRRVFVAYPTCFMVFCSVIEAELRRIQNTSLSSGL
jgi:hypothetical protein